MDFTNLINVDVDKRTSECIKQISRSERNNFLYLERNDRIPCPAFPVSWAVLALWAVAEFFVVFIKSFGVLRVGVFCFFFFMYRKSRAMLVLAFLL